MKIELTIDRPAAGGEFIAKVDGRIVFIAGALPGERVIAEVENDDPTARLWRANVVEILESSQHRRTGICAAAKAGAGCCDWDFIAPEYSAELKRDIVFDCLRRLGKFKPQQLPEIETRQLKPTSQWRTRVRLGVDKQGRTGLRAASSNELITGVECSQNEEGLCAGVSAIGTISAELTGQLAKRAGGRRRMRNAGPGELFIARDSAGIRNMVHVRGSGRNRRATVLAGSAIAAQKVNGVTFDVPVTGFWQSHVNAAETYVKLIEELLPASDGAVAWDLYGGAGVFALPLSSIVGTHGRVASVESYAASATAGKEALRDFPVTFLSGDVTEVIRNLPGTLAKPKYVVLDPPRAGAGKNAIQAIASAAPDKVVHIGCDPATCARDLSYWREYNYRVDRLIVIDAFPGTHHAETFALLQRDVQDG